MRLASEDFFQKGKWFQFTHPGRGATAYGFRGLLPQSPVSIHAPREGCDFLLLLFFAQTKVSIHAPREGCDFVALLFLLTLAVFQFTHPGRGATGRRNEADIASTVSIHAPREGCDQSGLLTDNRDVRFNSRTPGGVRLYGAKLPIMGRINKRNLRLRCCSEG